MRSPKVAPAMTTDVVVTTNVVKHFARDYGRRHLDTPSVAETSTFPDRVLDLASWLLAQLNMTTTDQDKGLSELARYAGLSRVTLSGAVRKAKAAKDHLGGTIRTAEALHRCSGVDLTWLICGKGEPGVVKFVQQPSRAKQVAKRTQRGTVSASVSGRHTVAPKRKA